MNNYINKEPDSESNLSDHGVRKYDNTIGRFITPDALWEKYYAWSPYHYSANPKNQRFFLRLKSGLTALESISNCAVNNPVNASDGNGDSLQFQDESLERAFNDYYNNASKSKRKGLDKLINSNQMYNVQYSKLSGRNAQTLYNFATHNVDLLIDNSIGYTGAIVNLADELTHAYQFEIGELGFIHDGRTLSYDFIDEIKSHEAAFLASTKIKGFIDNKGIKAYRNAIKGDSLIEYFHNTGYSFKSWDSNKTNLPSFKDLNKAVINGQILNYAVRINGVTHVK